MCSAKPLWLLCAALASVVAQEPRILAIGYELDLGLSSPPAKIDRVVWKHDANLLADVTNGRSNYYGPFRNHTTLDPSGNLNIKNIQRVHAGRYSVEVNYKVQEQQYDVQVLKKLDRPKVRAAPVSCSHTSLSCVLVCEVNTAWAGPVNYSWFFEDELSEVTTNELTITPSSNLPLTYTCEVNNPVSKGKSEPLENPLIPPASFPTAAVVCVVILIIGVLVAVVVYLKREVIKGICTKRGSGNPPGADPPAGQKSPPENEPLNSNEMTTENKNPPSEADGASTDM